MLVGIGQKIRKIRELKELTQEYIASELGISTRAYSKIETEETQLTINRLNQISSILNVLPQEILGFDASNIFNNNSTNQQGGEFIACNNTEVELLKKLYEQMIRDKERIIKELESQLNSKKT